MEKYLHQANEKPTAFKHIITFRNGKHRVVEVTDAGWNLVKSITDTWCYIDDIVEDIEKIRKMESAYNLYNKGLWKLREEIKDPELNKKISDLIGEANKLLS